LALCRRRGSGQGSGVAFGDVSLSQGLLNGRLEIQEPQRIGDGGSGSTDSAGDLILGQPELVGQLAVGVSLLHGVQVRSLNVLDNRYRELVALGHLTHYGRHVVQACHLRSSDTAFSGHQLVTIEDFCYEYRL
jgi:hypothetical protein